MDQMAQSCRYPAADASIENFVLIKGDQTVQLGGSGARQLVQGQQLATVEIPAVDHSIQLDITPGATIDAGWSNVVHFTTSVTTDTETYGSRVPGIWFWPGSRTLLVVSGHGADGNSNSAHWGCPNEYLTLDQSSLSRLTVTMAPRVQVFVNGTLVCSEDSGRSSLLRKGWQAGARRTEYNMAYEYVGCFQDNANGVRAMNGDMCASQGLSSACKHLVPRW